MTSIKLGAENSPFGIDEKYSQIYGVILPPEGKYKYNPLMLSTIAIIHSRGRRTAMYRVIVDRNGASAFWQSEERPPQWREFICAARPLARTALIKPVSHCIDTTVLTR